MAGMRLLSIVVVVFLTAASSRAGDLQILFPLYSYPNWYTPASYIWDDIAAANATVPITAIINPANGPGVSGPNSDYVKGMADLTAGGVKMIGYVSTSYGTRTLSAIESDIDLWASSFPGVTGIFLDEESTDPAKLAFYQTLHDYILAKPGLATVVANPGTNTPESFISGPTADTTVLFENGSGWGSYVTDSYVANYPRSSFAAVFYNLSTTAQMQAAVDLAQQRNFGYVFATDATGANPYDTLPTYWTAETSYVASVPEPTGAALLVLGGFLILCLRRFSDGMKARG
ncbi:MAG: spherulation-specific family 4 protein [Verrucomicrobiota bacterium]